MALHEGIAELLAKSNEALAATLAGALQNIKIARSPKISVPKFCGPPKKPGDLTVNEWLDEFDAYSRQLGLNDEEKVCDIIDHLSGVAKEEIMCAPVGERNTYEKVASLLQIRFGPLESVSSLTSALYARVQLEGESLADYSRALMRLHDRMEQASGERERAALRLLRDGVLKEQFVKGTRDVSVRRELRRILVERPKLEFFSFREHALALLPESDENSARRHKVRSTLASVGEGDHFEVAAATKVGGDVASQPTASDKLILEKLDALAQAQSDTVSQIQNLTSVLTQKLDAAISQRSSGRYVTCNYCKKAGHIAKYCRQRKADEEAPQNTIQANKTQGNSNPLP